VRTLFSFPRLFWFLPVLVLLLPSPARALRPPARRVLRRENWKTGKNLLRPGLWRFRKGGKKVEDGSFLLDNGKDSRVRRGISQTVILNQQVPLPIVASVWSKCRDVSGGPDRNYSLYLDLVYRDGTPLWGRVTPFDTGTHGWQEKTVMIFPVKPVRQVTVNLLLRRHSGKAWFREATLKELKPPGKYILFDGLPAVSAGPGKEGFFLRDAGEDSDIFSFRGGRALGVRLAVEERRRKGIRFFRVSLKEETGKDRAVTLYFLLPLPPGKAVWLQGPGERRPLEGLGDLGSFSSFPAGGNGRLSRWPFGAVISRRRGLALGLDPGFPAFFRVSANAGTRELYLAFDLGFTKEHPGAELRFCLFTFEPEWGFPSALKAYYGIYPRAFRCRTPEQGLWMPFARISKVKGWRDFGFKFKEGTGETAWDEAHGILTFRYTEPMTWWMPLPKNLPRTREAALAEARRLAARGRGRLSLRARALFTSGFHDEAGRIPLRFRNEPWCNGAVWSMNDMPGIRGEVTAFSLHWNARIRKKYYERDSGPRLDGEYVDSSEGWVTDVLDFRRDHFAAAATPLTFSLESRRPAIFRGLVAFEYVRALSKYVHSRKRLMMANATPSRLFWLAPLLDVMGTETNWHRGGRWTPMTRERLLYRRGMCGPKPYCFLMNTRFEDFSKELVEKYMKRAVAFGMFPGFFSADASTGHYFTRPELYGRDRPLFKKYVPLCKLLAQAGWEPVPLARTTDPDLQVERFGKRYLTVFNFSEKKTISGKVEIFLETERSARELLSGREIPLRGKGRGKAFLEIRLAPEDLAVLDLRPER